MDSGFEPGELIGNRWRVVEFVGQGAFGQVFRAVDESNIGLGDAAVKVLHPNTSPAERAEFLDEVKKIAQMRHPNLVAYMDSGEHITADGNARSYLVTEFCEKSLHDDMANGVLSPEAAVEVLRDVSAGLAHLHRRKLVHRDLKPANVLFAEGEWKLADFGLARDLSATGHYHHGDVVRGTPKFMAPELFKTEKASPAVDIYSVGVMMHLALTGAYMHEGTNDIGFIVNVTTLPPEVSPDLPAAWREFVEQATQIEPEARPEAATLMQVYESSERRSLEPDTLLSAPPAPQPTATRPTEIVAPPPPGGQVGQPSPPPAAPASPPTVQPTGPARPFAASAPPTSSRPVTPAPTPASSGEGNVTIPPHSSGAPGGGSDGRKPLLIGGGIVAALAAAAVAVVLITSGGGGDDPPVITETETAIAETSTPETETATPETETPTTEPIETSTPVPDETPTTAGSRIGTTVVSIETEVGDCLNFETAAANIETFDIVACTDPHVAEIAARPEHPDAGLGYPGVGSITDFANERCELLASAYIGVDLNATALNSVQLFPTEDEWNGGDFRPSCLLALDDWAPLTMSARDNGAAWSVGEIKPVTRLTVGECFTPVSVDTLELRSGDDVQINPCTSDHTGEFFGTVELDVDFGAPFPGEDVVRGDAIAACDQLFATHFGVSADGFDYRFWAPTEQANWDDGSRAVYCAILAGEPFRGALNFLGHQIFSELAIGTCFNLPANKTASDLGGPDNVLPVDCGPLHDGQFFGTGVIDGAEGSPFPGEDEVIELARGVCGPLFESFVGRVIEDSQLGSRLWRPTESGWDLGDRAVQCAFLSDEGFTGSYEGADI